MEEIGKRYERSFCSKDLGGRQIYLSGKRKYSGRE